MRARGRSGRTIDSYLETANQFAGFLPAAQADDLAVVARSDVEDYIVHVLDTRSAATARLRYASLKQLFKWARAEDEIPVDPMDGMTPPSQPVRDVPVITDDELKALLAATEGTTFEKRRDTAIIWTLLTTGIRVGEMVGMTTADVDLDHGTITVIGKGDRQRTVAIGDQTVLALDRYERARRKHPRAGSDPFWLSPKGGLTDSGLRQVMRRRGDDAGVPDLHPHRFRHTFAHRWLAKGGSEHGLQTAAGWRSPQMVARYGASEKAQRARDEAGRLGLEDL